MLFETVEQWLDAMTNHNCSNKELVPADDPSNQKIGYMCSNCTKGDHSENFEIDFKVVKTFDDLPNEKKDLVKQLLQSTDGRIKLGKSLSKKKIDVREVHILDPQLVREKTPVPEWMPIWYVTYFGILQEEARKRGYALAVHGSVKRDLDLILVPWIEDPTPHIDVLNAFCDILDFHYGPNNQPYTSKEDKPHNRVAYTVPVGCGGYLDISVILSNKERHVSTKM